MITRKTVIVLSGYVDSTIKEYQPDVEFLLFRTISDLSSYIEMSAVRADTLYITKDVITEIAVTTSLTQIMELLNNPFLRVENVEYITEKNSPEIATIKFMEESVGLKPWKITEGSLTREYITSLINGILKEDSFSPNRKVIYRMPREAYYRERREERKILEEDYETDEDYLADIPDEEPPTEILPDKIEPCAIKYVVGIDCMERTVLAFLCAQYMSLSGKTVILEKDIEYHRLTELVTKSGVDCEIILMSDILSNTEIMLNKIRTTDKSLICILTVERIKYSYSFMANLFINSLMEDISYFIQELDLNEVPSHVKSTIAIPSNMLGILQTVEKVDRSYIHDSVVVGISLGYLPEIDIQSTEGFSNILKDILTLENLTTSVVTVSTLRLSGEAYDLNKIF